MFCHYKMVTFALLISTLIASSLMGCRGSSSNQAPTSQPPTIPTTMPLTTLSNGFALPPERSVAAGESVVFQMVPDAGFIVSSVSGCDGELSRSHFTVTTFVDCIFSPEFAAERREDVSSLFELRTITVDGVNVDYHVYEPNVEPNKTYPLILAMHGTVEGAHIGQGLAENPHLADDIGGQYRPVASAWLQPHIRDQYPAYIIAPRIPLTINGEFNEHWYDEFLMSVFDQIIQQLVDTTPIDANRIYAVGHSAGGTVSWQIPGVLRNRFAALLPMSGGYIHNQATTRNEYSLLSIWSFGHVRDSERSVQAAQIAADELEGIGKKVTVFGNLNTQEARENAAKKLNQPLRYFASELNGNCVPSSNCHFEGIDAAVQEPLFFSWLFKQHRINPNAISLVSASLSNGSIDITWQVPAEGFNDKVSVWLDPNGNHSWILLDQAQADTLNFIHRLDATNDEPIKLRLTITNRNGFVYGIVDTNLQEI